MIDFDNDYLFTYSYLFSDFRDIEYTLKYNKEEFIYDLYLVYNNTEELIDSFDLGDKFHINFDKFINSKTVNYIITKNSIPIHCKEDEEEIKIFKI